MASGVSMTPTISSFSSISRIGLLRIRLVDPRSADDVVLGTEVSVSVRWWNSLKPGSGDRKATDQRHTEPWMAAVSGGNSRRMMWGTSPVIVRKGQPEWGTAARSSRGMVGVIVGNGSTAGKWASTLMDDGSRSTHNVSPHRSIRQPGSIQPKAPTVSRLSGPGNVRPGAWRSTRGRHRLAAVKCSCPATVESPRVAISAARESSEVRQRRRPEILPDAPGPDADRVLLLRRAGRPPAGRGSSSRSAAFLILCLDPLVGESSSGRPDVPRIPSASVKTARVRTSITLVADGQHPDLLRCEPGRGRHPAKCSMSVATMNRSIDPKGARWIITGRCGWLSAPM